LDENKKFENIHDLVNEYPDTFRLPFIDDELKLKLKQDTLNKINFADPEIGNKYLFKDYVGKIIKKHNDKNLITRKDLKMSLADILKKKKFNF
jgi:hypothetical protein